MARIIMLVTSELDRDPRVQKEALIAHQSGHDVMVICRSYEGANMPYEVKPLSIKRRDYLMAKYLERIFTNFKLAQFAALAKPDIIHSNDLDTLPAAYVAARWTKARLLYDAHELWSDIGEGRAGCIGKFIILFVERFLAQRADAVITVSSYRAQAMSKALHIPKPVVVMNTPYYVSPAKLRPGKWLHEFTGKRVVLYQGRYTEGMGLVEAIQSAKYLPSDIALVFRGYGPYEDTMRQVIEAEGLDKKVTLVPPVPMNDLVHSAVGADLGLVVYKPVNLNNLYAAPNKLFEFIMAGVPCVGSDLPYIREIIEGNQLGLVFKPGDPADLSRVILELLGDADRLTAMKGRCLDYAQQFCWEVEGAKLIQEYARLCHTN